MPLALLLLLLTTAAVLLILPSRIGPYAHLVWLGLALGLGLVVWTFLGNFADGVLVWLILTALFPAHFWRMDLPGFFNVTIGRIAISVLAVLFLLRSFLRGLPRLPGRILIIMFVLTGYFSLSAWQAGWTLTVTGAPPYYRLFVGYIFPFAAFLFTLAAFPGSSRGNDRLDSACYQRFIVRILWIFFAFGMYLTFTALCERFGLWSLVWPRFIASPRVGLNFGRARGPFAEAFAMALTLTFLFFVNLFLARRYHGPLRMLLWTLSLPILAAIYFTYTRTGYVCLLISAVLWIWMVGARLRRTSALAAISAILLAAVALNWATVSGAERTAGGLAEKRPILGRLAVSQLALELTAEHPLFGVGFGHYRQAVRTSEKDVSSVTAIYARHLSQSVAVLSVLCETGLIGLALYVALFIAILIPSIRLHRRLRPGTDGFVFRDFLVLFWILYIQTALMSITADPSYYPYTTGLLMFFAALICGLDFHLSCRPDQAAPAAALPDTSELPGASQTISAGI